MKAAKGQVWNSPVGEEATIVKIDGQKVHYTYLSGKDVAFVVCPIDKFEREFTFLRGAPKTVTTGRPKVNKGDIWQRTDSIGTQSNIVQVEKAHKEGVVYLYQGGGHGATSLKSFKTNFTKLVKTKALEALFTKKEEKKESVESVSPIEVKKGQRWRSKINGYYYTVLDVDGLLIEIKVDGGMVSYTTSREELLRDCVLVSSLEVESKGVQAGQVWQSANISVEVTSVDGLGYVTFKEQYGGKTHRWSWEDFTNFWKLKSKTPDSKTIKTCLTPGCGKPKSWKGICSDCYGGAKQLIERGLTDWIQLQNLGLVYLANGEKFIENFEKVAEVRVG